VIRAVPTPAFLFLLRVQWYPSAHGDLFDPSTYLFHVVTHCKCEVAIAYAPRCRWVCVLRVP
jgi:hypothetical protein